MTKLYAQGLPVALTTLVCANILFFDVVLKFQDDSLA